MSMKGGGSPGTTPRDQDTAFSAMSVNFGSPVPPVSSFAESPIFVSSPGEHCARHSQSLFDLSGVQNMCCHPQSLDKQSAYVFAS